MRILIVEPEAEGHHGTYLRWLVAGILARGWDYTIATTRTAAERPLIAPLIRKPEHLAVIATRGDGPTSTRRLALLRQEARAWRSFRDTARAASRRVALDAVLMPYVDYCFHMLALRGSPFGQLPWC